MTRCEPSTGNLFNIHGMSLRVTVFRDFTLGFSTDAGG